MVGQTIQQRGGHFGVAKNFRPFGKGEIGGDQQRGVFVELARLAMIMSSSFPATSNDVRGRVPQAPFPALPLGHPERLIFSLADLIP
jgi:hypothetical protein